MGQAAGQGPDRGSDFMAQEPLAGLLPREPQTPDGPEASAPAGASKAGPGPWWVEK